MNRHVVVCISWAINGVCAFENIFAFRVVLTRSLCINYRKQACNDVMAMHDREVSLYFLFQ